MTKPSAGFTKQTLRPKKVTAGRSICATISKPCRNSWLIRATSASMSPVRAASSLRSSPRELEISGHVRLVHAEHEQHGKPEIGGGDSDPLPWEDAVVGARRGVPSHLPAPPQLHRGEDEDDDEDRVGPDDDERAEPDE